MILQLALFSAGVSANLFHGDERQILSFTRNVTGCDEDLPIPNAVSRVIWAHGPGQPEDPTKASYHIARGSKSFGIKGRVPLPPVDESLDYFDIRMDNMYIPATAYDDPDTVNKTSYMCGAFEIPKRFLDGKRRHMVRSSPIITEGNYDKVHHIIMYTCNTLLDETIGYFGHCDMENMPSDLAGCNVVEPVIAGYAIGGDDQLYPNGFPIGDNGDAVKRLYFEMHYDNYDRVPFYDSSGLRLYISDNMEEEEGGVFWTGSVQGIKVPPGVKEHHMRTRCPGTPDGCLVEGAIPAEGITITHSLMHMHTAGKSMTAKIVDGKTGKVKHVVGHEPHYDFNIQQYFRLDEPVKMMPGDHLDVDCTFNTEDRDWTTIGGRGTPEEMCLAYLVYYPRIPMHSCIYYNVPEDLDLANGFEYSDITPNGRSLATCKKDGINYHVVDGFNMDRVEEEEEKCVPTVPPQGASIVPQAHGFQEHSDIENFLAQHTYHEKLHHGMDVYWDYNKDLQTVDFTIDARTGGWVGFGISRTGGMNGADMVMGWVTNEGTTYMQDRFSTMNGMPKIDTVQSIWNIRGTRILRSGEIIVDASSDSSDEGRMFDSSDEGRKGRGRGRGDWIRENMPLFVGITVGGGCLLLIVLILALYCCCCCKNAEEDPNTTEMTSTSGTNIVGATVV